MYLISVAIGAAALLWSARLFMLEGDRRLIWLAGLPVLLLLFDVVSLGEIRFPSQIDPVLMAVTHAYVLGIVIWVAVLLRRHTAAVDRHRKDLESAHFDSEAMRRLKGAFLANMNHEIRTPLTSIIGFSSLLMAEVDPEHRNMMRVIERSGQRLLDTLDSFLDLAMLESGRIQLNYEVVDLAEEARFHAARFGPLARGKGLALHVEVPAGSLRASVDRACLSRIFSRLLSNAVKFTKEGSVTIEVSGCNGRCHIAVRDTGIGIEEEYLPYLFDEFTQASSGTGRSFEGSGLGLAVTKRLVDLLDGTMDVETRPFFGSTFMITLPAFAAGGDGALANREPDLLPQLHER